jgi:hypothetical protein
MHDDRTMRTTLDLDDDVLQAAKELARRRGTTAGRIVSDLVRAALRPARPARVRNGVPILPPLAAGAPPVTEALVNQLRDE